MSAPHPKLPHLQSAESSLSMKIARFWQDTDVTWMAVPRRMAARRLFDLVGRADFGIEAPFVAQRIEHRRPADVPRRHQVDHPFLASLPPAPATHQRAGNRRLGNEGV